MTTSQNIKRRLVAAIITASFGVGGLAAAHGISTSPGRTGAGGHHREMAIPGVRGTGGGGGTSYGVSTSPGRTQSALSGRKAGGTNPLEHL